MKKLILLLFILPIFCFAQTNVTPQWKKFPVFDSLGYSITGITGNHWLYDAHFIRVNYLTKSQFTDSLRAHKIYFTNNFQKIGDTIDLAWGNIVDTINAHGADGIVSGLITTTSGTTATTTAGTYRLNNAFIVKSTSTNTTIPAQNATQNRYTLIVGDASGVFTAVNGTLADDPVEPDIPTNKALIASIYIPKVGGTTTTTGGGSGKGTVTKVTSSTTDILIANQTTTPILTLNKVNGFPITYYNPTSPIQTQLNGKQVTLVSGTNIKTINGVSVLGSGNLVIGGSDSTLYKANGHVAENRTATIDTTGYLDLITQLNHGTYSEMFLNSNGIAMNSQGATGSLATVRVQPLNTATDSVNSSILIGANLSSTINKHIYIGTDSLGMRIYDVQGYGLKYTSAFDYRNLTTDTLALPPVGWVQRYVGGYAKLVGGNIFSGTQVFNNQIQGPGGGGGVWNISSGSFNLGGAFDETLSSDATTSAIDINPALRIGYTNSSTIYLAFQGSTAGQWPWLIRPSSNDSLNVIFGTLSNQPLLSIHPDHTLWDGLGHQYLTGQQSITNPITGLQTVRINYDIAKNPSSTITTGAYDAFPLLVQMQSNNLLLIYRHGTTHASDAGTMVMRTSTDGGANFSAPVTILSESGVDIRNACGGVTPTNRLIVFFDKYDPINALTISQGYIYSDNEGATWSTYQTIGGNSHTFYTPYGNMISIGGGKLMMPWYGSGGPNNYSSYVITSTDNGATWSAPVTVVTDVALAYGEASYAYLDGGILIGLIRNSGVQFTQVKSTDNGATWTNQGATAFDVASLVSPWLTTYNDVDGNKYVIAYYCDRSASLIRAIAGTYSGLIAGVSGWLINSHTNVFTNSNNNLGYPSVINPRQGKAAFGMFYAGADASHADLHFFNFTPSSYSQSFYNSINILGASAAFNGSIVFPTATAARTFTLPNATGTFALTSDVSSIFTTTHTWGALQTFGTNISIGGITATGATGTGNISFSDSPVITTQATLTRATSTPTFNFTRVKTSLTAPTPVQSGDNLGNIVFNGQYDSTLGDVTAGAFIFAAATANFSSTTVHPTDLVFNVSPASGAAAEKMRLVGTGNLLIGTATDDTKNKLQVNGAILHGIPTEKATSTTAINSTATITAAQLATGVITSTSAAGTTMTLPTATLMATQLGAAQGTHFHFTIDNTAGASTVTLVLGSGMTQLTAITGANTLTIASGAAGVGVFDLYFSSTTACTFSRIE